MIPDHAALEIIPIVVVFHYFPLGCSVFSFFLIIDNFLRTIPDEDDSSSSIRYTSVFSHAELDLSIEYLPIIVVFEIQALVAT